MSLYYLENCRLDQTTKDHTDCYKIIHDYIHSDQFQDKYGDFEQIVTRMLKENQKNKPKSPKFDVNSLTAIITILIGVVLVLFVIVSIVMCFYFKCMIRGRSTRHANIGVEIDEESLERIMTSNSIIEKSIPCEIYSNDTKIAGQHVCTICLLDFAESDIIRITKCHHSFHKSCIDE